MQSPLCSAVRRILGLPVPSRRRCSPRSFVLLTVVAALSWASGLAAAPPPQFRQEKIPGLSSFDVAELAIPDLADLDGDGDLDLVSGNYAGRLRFFENVGNQAAPVFREVAGLANPFRLVSTSGLSSPDLADIDGDGDRDLVLGEMNGGLRYFRNTGSAASPAFLEQTSGANPFFGLSVGSRSSPDLADLDNDGDLDAAVGETGGRVFYFINTGSSSVPAFASAGSNPFTGIDVGSYSTPQLADLDADGDLDLAVGELYGRPFYFLNTGSAAAPAFVAVTGSNNPFAVVPGAQENTFANLALADLDGNGVRDLVLGEQYGAFIYYRNSGSASAPAFIEAETSPFVGADLDSFASVAMADLDLDGDLDAITGQYSNLRYFLNTGSARQPAFRELSGGENPILSGAEGDTLAPALVDLDNDGDFDLMAADYDGAFHFLLNTGSASAPAFVTAPASANPFTGLSVTFGQNHPAFGDLDGDGDHDLVVAHSTAAYFENTGTPAAPDFVRRTGSANPFGTMDFFWGGSPQLIDYDGDGDLDLVAGGSDGDFRYFSNTGQGITVAFVEQHEAANPFAGPDIGVLSVPAIVDLDGDGDLDLVATESGGWLVYFADFATDVFTDGFESGDTRQWSAVVP